ncbi:MAG: hypothetical protein COB66_05310 [Coxiella sp. (in: Bacteria)]|nr:MAG: hypothetical protein COB66_05310 [Coxiella sp. (in: g-proteobacteria)]
MIIIGLGSNVGDRLNHLRRALAFLKEHPKIDVCHVSPVYESDAQLLDNAPPSWNTTFFNAAVSCKTDLSPFSLLHELQQMEQHMGRTKWGHWSPRNIDLDILLWGDISIDTEALTIPHKQLVDRPFVLWPVMDLFSNWPYPKERLEQWGSRFSGEAPFRTRQVPYRIDGSIFMGALNITPDSFSDGGQFYDADKAVARAKQLFASGAEVIDLGAESTRPDDNTHVTPEVEWARLEGVIKALMLHWKGNEFRPKLCVDTRHHQTAEKAIAAGVDWINDVTGFRDRNLLKAVQGADVTVVSMHSLSIPPTQQAVIPLDKDPIEYLLRWGERQLALFAKHNISKGRVILDPGVGFGKTPEQCLSIIKRAAELKRLGVPILVGHARKSFHKVVTSVPAGERELETALAAAHLFAQGVDYIRVHEVAYSLRAVAMQQRLNSIQTQQEKNYGLLTRSQPATRSKTLTETSLL